MKFLAFLVAISLGLILFAPAGEEPEAGGLRAGRPADRQSPDQAMQEMYAKYGMPGKEHEILKTLVGTWDMEVKAWLKPGDPPMESRGTQTNQLLLGGRFIEIKLEIAMGEMKLTGVEILGFDRFQDKYAAFYVDDSTTSLTVVAGTADASGKILTLSGTSPDLRTGKMERIRTVTTILGDDKYRFEIFMVSPGGQDFKNMEFTATRTKM